METKVIGNKGKPIPPGEYDAKVVAVRVCKDNKIIMVVKVLKPIRRERKES